MAIQAIYNQPAQYADTVVFQCWAGRRRCNSIKTSLGEGTMIALTFDHVQQCVSKCFKLETDVLDVPQRPGQIFFLSLSDLRWPLHPPPPLHAYVQKTRHVDWRLAECWASVADNGPAFNEHCVFTGYLRVPSAPYIYLRVLTFNWGPVWSVICYCCLSS